MSFFCLWGSWITVIPPPPYAAVFSQSLSLHVLKLTSYTVCVCVYVRAHSVWAVCMSSSMYLSLHCVCVCVCASECAFAPTPPQHQPQEEWEREERWTTERLTSWHHKPCADWLLLKAGGFISQLGASVSAAASLSSEQHPGKTQEINSRQPTSVCLRSSRWTPEVSSDCKQGQNEYMTIWAINSLCTVLGWSVSAAPVVWWEVGGQVNICASCWKCALFSLKENNSTFRNLHCEKVWCFFMHFKYTTWPQVRGHPSKYYCVLLVWGCKRNLRAACTDILEKSNSNFMAIIWRRPSISVREAGSVKIGFSHFTPHPTSFGWTGAPNVSQASSSNISVGLY